jgi:acetylornithine/N-succinyldiaminopimelate aminotransferase
MMEEMETAAQTIEDTSVSHGIISLERQYLLQNYSRYPLVLSKGKGCYVYDPDGKRYLDLISGIGVNALGHAHPRLTRIIRDQASSLLHTSNLYYNEFQGLLAKKLCETSGLNRAFFCNSGTEAVEAAIKMMHSHGNRAGGWKNEIIALDNSFHGRTVGALSITGQPKYRADFEPLMPGARFVAPNNIAALEQAVSERTAGIIIEPIQGEGGVYPQSSEFLRRARALADRYNALLVFDEVQCGVGRTGVYYSYQLADTPVYPDVMVAAKPLGCGVPMGAVVANERAASTIGPGMHGSTFGGGALACRIALEFFDILPEILPSIRSVGAFFREELLGLQRKFGFIKEIRAHGLMIGMELEFPCKQLVLDGIGEGLLFNCTHDRVLRFLPPYIITENEVSKATKTLKKLFGRIRLQ